MPLCVYCGRNGALTREHVLPAFLYDYVDKEALGGLSAWNEPTKSRVGGEHKVKDVCAACNNGALSELDAFGKEFLESNGLLSPLYGSRLRLSYDYNLLLRWVLKIHFNAARASRYTSAPSSKYVDYILLGRGAPPHSRVFLMGELLRPHKIQDPRSPFIGTANADGFSNPFMVRVTRSPQLPDVARNLHVESIGFGGLFFHIAYVRDDLPTSLAMKLKSRVIRETAASGKLIRHDRDSVEFVASSRDFVDMRKAQNDRESVIRATGVDPYHGS